MKLYMWNCPNDIKYGGSMLIVLAENEEQARQQAMNAMDLGFGREGKKEVSFQNLDAPDIVQDIQRAYYYWWQE